MIELCHWPASTTTGSDAEAADPRDCSIPGRRKLCIPQQLKAPSYHRTAVGVVGPGASRRVRRMAQRGLLKQVPLKDGAIISPRYDWPKPDGEPCLPFQLSANLHSTKL